MGMGWLYSEARTEDHGTGNAGGRLRCEMCIAFSFANLVVGLTDVFSARFERRLLAVDYLDDTPSSGTLNGLFCVGSTY